MSFIGVDLHTTSFTVCRLEEDGSKPSKRTNWRQLILIGFA